MSTDSEIKKYSSIMTRVYIVECIIMVLSAAAIVLARTGTLPDIAASLGFLTALVFAVAVTVFNFYNLKKGKTAVISKVLRILYPLTILLWVAALFYYFFM